MNEKSTLLLKSQGKLIIVLIMLIILLNIIPVFNDDWFGLFFNFISLNSSCYIFV